MEQWRSVVGYEGLYEVSDMGRVRSLDRIRLSGLPLKGRVLKPGRVGRGYLNVVLQKDGKRKNALVHRLVLEVFVGPCPDGMEGCHDPDHEPSNNRLSNLRWDTHAANGSDMKRHGRANGAMGERSGSAKRTERDIEQMFAMRAAGMSQHAIAKHFNADQSCVSRALRGIEWPHVYARITAGERSSAM